MYVDDVAAALVSLLRRPGSPAGVFNVGSGRATPVLDMARLVASELGMGETGLSMADPAGAERGTGAAFWADLTRMTAATGWRPVVDLASGIRQTIAAARPAKKAETT